MIEVNQLSKSYPDLRVGEILAVDQLSFRAQPGQIFGLLGPNGAGKTTVLRILSTMLKPSSGTVVVNGFNVVEQPEQVRRHIGFVSGNLTGYERMTAREMVEFFGRLHGMQKEQLEERIKTVFEWLQMEEISDRLGAKMSTGMKQKVSIARAVVHDPPVLIFDEATVGLDVLVARSLLETIGQLRDDGKCIIFSTHHMREAEKLCDHIAILHRGSILADGTLQTLLEGHGGDDLEQVFFDLISQYDEAGDEADDVVAGSAGAGA
ncbi:MAG: ATP-binding cassette domain-containing protein [Pirellulaceae bacterium]